MKVPVRELLGDDLDRAVAIAMGYTHGFPESLLGVRLKGFGKEKVRWHPSTDPTQAYALIVGSDLSIIKITKGWRSYAHAGLISIDGDTPLIAAMRCFVCLKLGDMIDLEASYEPKRY